VRFGITASVPISAGSEEVRPLKVMTLTPFVGVLIRPAGRKVYACAVVKNQRLPEIVVLAEVIHISSELLWQIRKLFELVSHGDSTRLMRIVSTSHPAAASNKSRGPEMKQRLIRNDPREKAKQDSEKSRLKECSRRGNYADGRSSKTDSLHHFQFSQLRRSMDGIELVKPMLSARTNQKRVAAALPLLLDEASS
jgi:hypothetical protein